MKNIRLSRALCQVVAEVLIGSHQSLNALFQSAGAPGDPPDLAHHSKWKEWLFRSGQDPAVNSLSVLGNVLEEFMDVAPADDKMREEWAVRRQRVLDELEKNGLRYFQGGRVLPTEQSPSVIDDASIPLPEKSTKPSDIEGLLKVLVRGLPRAMYPLQHRRKDARSLTFYSEYDIQDLLHALLRPWISDIRPEEFSPSYAGSSTRMDFLLPAYSLVIETKLVRDKAHASKIGNELIIDIDHYRVHPNCSTLWCVIYDPNNFIENVGGLKRDLEGPSQNNKGKVTTRVFVLR